MLQKKKSMHISYYFSSVFSLFLKISSSSGEIEKEYKIWLGRIPGFKYDLDEIVGCDGNGDDSHCVHSRF